MDIINVVTSAIVIFTPIEYNQNRCVTESPGAIQLYQSIEESKMRYKKGNRWGKNRKLEMRYKKWRRNVFELNKRKIGLSRHYVCVKCNKKRKTTRVLHAHHIFSWEKFENKRYNYKNGCVLCKPCHHQFHMKYKFEALKKPELMLEWLGDIKNKDIMNYINEEK